MSANTPNTPPIHELLYGIGDMDNSDLELHIERLDSKRIPSGKFKQPSAYVTAFEKMVMTVYESESHLLTAKEINMLDAFSKLDYNARYILVRNLLRKPNTWHSFKSMENFKKEIDEDGLICAIFALCQPIEDEPPIKEEVKEQSTLEGLSAIPKLVVIDLTFDSDDEETKPVLSNAKAGPSNWHKDQDVKPSLNALLQGSDSPPYEPDFSFFMEDESSMSLEEVLRKLNNDQLRELVKETKIKPDKMKKDTIISALLYYASTQTPLTFEPITKGGRTRISHDGLKQTLLPFQGKVKGTQENRLLQMARAKLGKCVRVNVDFYWLVARLSVIYERSTQYPKCLLVPSLLVSFKKRTYPEYVFTRDNMIWSTRDEFMDYFEALKLESAIETELETPPADQPSTMTPTPRAGSKYITPVPSRTRQTLTTPLRTPMSAGRATENPAVCKKEEDHQEENHQDDELDWTVEGPSNAKAQAALTVKKFFDDVVLKRWDECLVRRTHCIKDRSPGLERFEPGFVYTRIFGKIMRALQILKLHSEENVLLEALLGQPFWRQGKRAQWYDRRALLHTTYLCKSVDNSSDVLYKAMEGLKEALNDDGTHLVYRPKLVRRLIKLEKKLKISEEDRCSCSGELRNAESVQFSAERIFKSDKSLKLDAQGRPVKDLHSYFSPNPNVINATPNGKIPVATPAKNPSDKWKWKGKSIWQGRDGEQINVECRALQFYEESGYKGFHSETRILTTLFSLLFWDIIFADVPGAFETAYQTAPLDLMEDSFYLARKDLIDTRLEEIKHKGRAQEIVKRHDDRYREKNTWCVGVRWDICTQDDLLEIVECLGGESLTIICRLFCEDYGGRSSGVPDLIIWDISKGLCKFVEVKGPGDRPQENQKLWFDSLLRAGANVEICNVLDRSNPPKPRTIKKPRGSKSKNKGKTYDNSDFEMDSDDPGNDDHSRGESCTAPPNVRKRKQPPDENVDVLPTFSHAATPPKSPPGASSMRRLQHMEVVVSPSKKRRSMHPPS